jgi:hypothetical protein
MRIYEFENNTTIALSNEENAMVNAVRREVAITRSALTERGVVVANQLVSKNVLSRKKVNGKTTYSIKK